MHPPCGWFYVCTCPRFCGWGALFCECTINWWMSVLTGRGLLHRKLLCMFVHGPMVPVADCRDRHVAASGCSWVCLALVLLPSHMHTHTHILAHVHTYTPSLRYLYGVWIKLLPCLTSLLWHMELSCGGKEHDFHLGEVGVARIP